MKHGARASLSLWRLLKSTGWHAAQPSLWLAVLCGLKCLQLATAVTAFNFCWLLLLLSLFFLLIAIRLCWPSYISALLLAFLCCSLSMSSASHSISYFIGKDWPCFAFSNQQEKSFSAVSQLITTCLIWPLSAFSPRMWALFQVFENARNQVPGLVRYNSASSLFFWSYLTFIFMQSFVLDARDKGNRCL